MSLSAVILAGGKSSRMGRDKALLPFGEFSSLSEYQYIRLKPLFDKVYLSAKENKFEFEAEIIYDIYKEYNPLNALISAFKTTKSDAIFMLSVDMPLLEIDSINSLIQAYKDNSGNYSSFSMASNLGVEPLATIYTRGLLDIAEDMYKECNYKMKNLIYSKENYKLYVKKIETTNINREKEYKKVLNYLK